MSKCNLLIETASALSDSTYIITYMSRKLHTNWHVDSRPHFSACLPHKSTSAIRTDACFIYDESIIFLEPPFQEYLTIADHSIGQYIYMYLLELNIFFIVDFIRLLVLGFHLAKMLFRKYFQLKTLKNFKNQR